MKHLAKKQHRIHLVAHSANHDIGSEGQVAILDRLDSTAIPAAVFEAWKRDNPQGSSQLYRQACEHFKDYLKIVVLSPKATALPSAAADSVWHAFLTERAFYEDFCWSTMGRVVPHIEEADFAAPMADALGETWKVACRLEGIDPQTPSRLPRLFAFDREVRWPKGFYYTLDPRRVRVTHTEGGRGLDYEHPWTQIKPIVVHTSPSTLTKRSASSTTKTSSRRDRTDSSDSGSDVLNGTLYTAAMSDSTPSSSHSTSHGSSCGSHGHSHGSSCGSTGSSCGSSSSGSSCGSSCGGGGGD